MVYPIIERVRKAEEERKGRIEKRLQELESSVKSCDAKAISHAYFLGEEKTTMQDAEKISRLIAQFELDCGCIVLKEKI